MRALSRRSQERPDEFAVALVGRLKHGDIIEGLARKGWNQSDLARALECSPTVCGAIVNFKWVPSKEWMTAERERVFFELTWKLPEELWPDWMHEDAWTHLDKRVRSIRSVPVRALREAAEAGLLTAPISDPYVLAERHELTAKVENVLKSLTPREERVIRRRFGFNSDTDPIRFVSAGYDTDESTLADIARVEGRHKERIRQIEAKALRKMRHPQRSRILRSFLEFRYRPTDHDSPSARDSTPAHDAQPEPSTPTDTGTYADDSGVSQASRPVSTVGWNAQVSVSVERLTDGLSDLDAMVCEAVTAHRGYLHVSLSVARVLSARDDDEGVLFACSGWGTRV